ncbi:MAG: hypothetical protein LW822_08150 [Phycisphaeraceae bacterium]|nr:hypothetical protein [Phycisphaeraceae bacterium]
MNTHVSLAKLASAAVALSPLPALAQNLGSKDVEPNETIASASPVTLTPNQSFEGTSTGSSTQSGAGASMDFFRITASGLTGIRRNRLLITTTGTAGHTGAIFAQTVTNGVAVDAWEIFQQTSINTTPARMLQFYSVGVPSVELLVRITGTAQTFTPYRVQLVSEAVTRITGPVGLIAGEFSITTSGLSHTTDTEMVLFNATTFAPIAWNDNNPAPFSTLTPTLAAGDYVLAIGSWNTVSYLLPAPTEPSQNGQMVPSAGFIAGGNTQTPVDLSVRIRGGNNGGGVNTGTYTSIPVTRPGPYGVAFIDLKVRCPGDIAGPGQRVGGDGSKTADDLIVYLNWFFARNALADVAGPGQSSTPDGQFTADDLIVFLSGFFAQC